MSRADLSGLNAGYVAQMLEAYLDAPASVPDEWRELFERDPEAFAGSLPGLAGLLGTSGRTAPPTPTPRRQLPPRRPGRAAPPAAASPSAVRRPRRRRSRAGAAAPPAAARRPAPRRRAAAA